ncbi:MAG: polymer-forming cytoskeletal protein [Paenibacillaceae bacterium]|nr:polymer-forming cytoskeletal protein [Paenibacillaceae bacterium]
MLKNKIGIHAGTDTLVGEGTVVEGKMISSGGIRVEGQVIGDLECEGDVTVGEHAMMKSNITAANITIAGQVSGNIIAKEKLVILPTGQLLGTIDVRSFTIMEGGVFQGTSKMEPRQPDNLLQTKRELKQQQNKQKNESAAAAN